MSVNISKLVIASATRVPSFLIISIQLMFLMLIPNNKIITYLVDCFADYIYIFVYAIITRPISVRLIPYLGPLCGYGPV